MLPSILNRPVRLFATVTTATRNGCLKIKPPVAIASYRLQLPATGSCVHLHGEGGQLSEGDRPLVRLRAHTAAFLLQAQSARKTHRQQANTEHTTMDSTQPHIQQPTLKAHAFETLHWQCALWGSTQEARCLVHRAPDILGVASYGRVVDSKMGRAYAMELTCCDVFHTQSC